MAEYRQPAGGRAGINGVNRFLRKGLCGIDGVKRTCWDIKKKIVRVEVRIHDIGVLEFTDAETILHGHEEVAAQYGFSYSFADNKITVTSTMAPYHTRVYYRAYCIYEDGTEDLILKAIEKGNVTENNFNVTAAIDWVRNVTGGWWFDFMGGTWWEDGGIWGDVSETKNISVSANNGHIMGRKTGGSGYQINSLTINSCTINGVATPCIFVKL